ncbi:MAG TPA: peptidoglycan DD-metalloendopeptidase family protein [Chitinophaga sp.]|uniref:peptidoglycan DD-metalloendopeptidase family protein n=1 Tax=Chitinophaga sp. TaxID=1869181 RepID=UPI002DBCEE5C|nr:peptidoglycan DD-metalloendopeptidase family protein [Chitinophaga sp.]HEU4553965.1 peptidoglycan DD-metalloendopeptidase family protein [Chitinophaga sp.]
MIRKLIGFCCLVPQLLNAQYLPEKNYPQGYFRDPLNIPIILAGNFGELRPNHFHSGMDIKTQQRENLPVHAAADGYVSRISVSHTGYGNGLYITHPNGYTTVYGHLNRFFPALERYVKQKEYEQEDWAIDLEIPPGMFPVKKGDFVAWSGNTGGSTGPHLHFEIRNTQTMHPLNPLLFGFDVPDKRAPEVYRVAVFNREKSIYEQQPVITGVKKVNGEYVTTTPLIKVRAAKAGIGINGIDRQSNSTNPNGIYEVILFDNDVPNEGFQLDDIGYEETRYLNAHIDYKVKKGGGPYLQLVFPLPGNKLNIYHDIKGNGTIDLSDGAVHHVKLLVKDAYGNTSTVKFNLQQSGSEPAAASCANTMYPGSRNIFENNWVEFFLDETALYDQVCFRYSEVPSISAKSWSNIYHLHTPLVPIHTSFDLRLKPDKPVPPALQPKIVMVRTGLGEDASGTTYENGWFTGRFRDFGNFHLEVDTIAPTISVLGGIRNGANLARATRLSFRMNDNSGIKSYRAELDGHWLMFSRKGTVLTYTFDEHCPPGGHTLKLTVTDIAGNEGVHTLTFKR